MLWTIFSGGLIHIWCFCCLGATLPLGTHHASFEGHFVFTPSLKPHVGLPQSEASISDLPGTLSSTKGFLLALPVGTCSVESQIWRLIGYPECCCFGDRRMRVIIYCCGCFSHVFLMITCIKTCLCESHVNNVIILSQMRSARATIWKKQTYFCVFFHELTQT